MTQKPMTKTQLVAALSEKADIDKSTANRTLDALTTIVMHEVAQGGAVTLPGLGQVRVPRPSRAHGAQSLHGRTD